VIGYSALIVEEARRLALENPQSSKRLTDYAVVVEKAAEYCHHLSENWRLASKKSAEFADTDLVAVANEVKQVIFFNSPSIEITGVSEGVIRGARYELMRVFQNLFKNAIEAGATKVVAEFSARGTSVVVSVSDNGPGMDADHVHRVMHGGFTTKENGTGLGLSICRHLTGSHGGHFELESKVGKGTTIRLTFPRIGGK
jgi:signal transduction histidine kinase